MLHPRSIRILRKARLWPDISKETVTLPQAPSPVLMPQPTILIAAAFSLVGTGIMAFFLSGGSGSGANILPFVILSGVMALGSFISFLIQSLTARRRMGYLADAYQKKLQETEKRLQSLQDKERQSYSDLYPPFVLSKTEMPAYERLQVLPLVQRILNDQEVGLWVRRQVDPDFMTIRIGMGERAATFKVRGSQADPRIAMPNKLDSYNEYARTLIEKYAVLQAPITIKLDSNSPVAIVGAQLWLARARELARAMIVQLVYHHSPEDVRIIVLAPQSQEANWNWAQAVPHTSVYDPRQASEGNTGEISDAHAVAIGNEAVANQLPLISRELGRRELLLGDARQASRTVLIPQLVIVVDHFDPANDLDQPTLVLPKISTEQRHATLRQRSSLSISPLKRPELTLALSSNPLLGVSVLCVCTTLADVPTTSGIMIDLESAGTLHLPGSDKPVIQPQAIVRILKPEPPPIQVCKLLDRAPLEAIHRFAKQLYPLYAASTKRLELRTQVDLRMLFEPCLDLEQYAPQARWNDPAFRRLHQTHGEVPTLRIPIGLKVADELQYLDLLKDGPHGLLIGQTGSGKSELLQTIITALAIAYRPTEINFLLIDYKAGLALEPFRQLPHTIGFLSNVSSPALIQRFITMLKAEATRREVRIKTEKSMPRLLIIIDEFAEMAKRTEAVLEELFTITRVGREIGMHLLLAAQRPEGIISSKVRDYVQYRLCLRCASPEDSREVLRRIDAANLPASVPGRGYLLHGDNQLDLFQSARVALTISLQSQSKPSSFNPFPLRIVTKTTTLAEAIVTSIKAAYSREEAQKENIIFWPDPLPTPLVNHMPDPLTLFHIEPKKEHTSLRSPTVGEEEQRRIALIPLNAYEALGLRHVNPQKSSMQIPLGLIDKPEIQQREIFQIDLQGSSGALTGGPLLIAGAQHSGKANALETMLLWLTTRYSSQQLRCIVIDPLQELDYFQNLSHLKLEDGSSLWSDGSTDQKVIQLAEQVTTILNSRRAETAVTRWDDATLANLWAQGREIPQIILIISHYQSFAERSVAALALKKLALAVAEARIMGIYLVITSTEVSGKYLPSDLMGKFTTKVALYLNETQRFELLGRTPLQPDPIPGRGIALTPDRSLHHIQMALPTIGASEQQRRENLKRHLDWLMNQH